MESQPITVETTVRAPLARVWEAWNTPRDIMQWNAASDDWHTTASRVDLREGGRFSSRMEAKDGRTGFDFEGTYTQVMPQARIEYAMDNGRRVSVAFADHGDGRVSLRETFDPEPTHDRGQQQQGWQAILDNFKRHVEQGG